ncbi:MAG: hypothetical protein JNL82_29550 [Myxococcales bacterium]|nr:hypothetical protein [Myxococcales bacterium]
MAREYIVEEVRVTGGSMRLRDSITGELVDVSITPGAAFTPPKPADRRETGASARATAPAEELPAASKTVTTSADESDARPAEKRKRKKRKRTEGRQGSSPEPEAAGSGVNASTIGTAPMTTQESREIVIDESTLSEDDKAVLAKVRSVLVKSRRNNKRGELGWKEITVDGRSGVMARWGKGQFKILHAGDDTYALFYEWDGGKWQQVACGSAEDLMHIAGKRAREEVPTAPLTTLTLEMARYMCGTPAQRAAARERLAPVLAETDKPLVKLPDIDLTGKITVVKPTSAEPAATTADEVNPDLDEKIGGSLKKILEDM